MPDDSDQGTGSGSPNEPNGSGSAAVSITEDKVNEIVSKAIGKRFQALETKQAKAFEEFGASLATKLTESVMGAVGEKLEALKPTTGASDKGKTPENPEELPFVKGLKKQIADLQKRDQERELAEKAKDAQLKDVKLREKLTSLLSANGIEGVRAQHAMGYLVDAAKRVSWGEDGESLTFKDESGDLVDAATGLKSWVTSADGKLYAPPSNASGSGERGTGSKAPVTTNGGKQPSTTEIGQGIANAFGIAVS